MDMQTATEAAKSSSAIYFDWVAIMALIGVAGFAVREFIISYRNRKNGNGLKPGLAPQCLRHEVELTRIDIEGKNAREDIIEMKGDIKELLRRIPPR